MHFERYKYKLCNINNMCQIRLIYVSSKMGGERERVEDSQVEGFSSRILLNEIIF